MPPSSMALPPLLGRLLSSLVSSIVDLAVGVAAAPARKLPLMQRRSQDEADPGLASNVPRHLLLPVHHRGLLLSPILILRRQRLPRRLPAITRRADIDPCYEMLTLFTKRQAKAMGKVVRVDTTPKKMKGILPLQTTSLAMNTTLPCPRNIPFNLV